MRSGINPLDAIRKLEGRIVSFHFKDRQKIKAVLSIEYEYHWENSLPEIAEPVACFDRIAAELAGG
jgi:hypothetical protein